MSRWETLVKDYNGIEKCCNKNRVQDHRELDESEFASVKLATAYQQDWYDIVEEVCRQRKRKERGDRDLMPAKRSKGPERPPNRDTLCPASTSKSVAHHDQLTPESTSAYAQVSFSPRLEADKLSSGEEVLTFNMNRNDGLVLEVTGQHRQVSDETLESADLQAYLWELVDAMVEGTSAEIEECETKSEVTESIHSDLELVGLGAQPKEPLQDHVRDDSFETTNASSARCNDSRLPIIYSGATAAANRSLSVFVFLEALGAWLCAAIMTPCTSSQSADLTISRQSRRWSLKVILLKIRQYCHPRSRKNRTEDVEMESKQTVLLKGKARKKALMPRKENVPPMLDAASSTSATSATRGNEPLQKDTERISEPAALDKKEAETMPRKAERQQLGGKSSSKCVPIGKLCAELGRSLFPAFHGQSSH